MASQNATPRVVLRVASQREPARARAQALEGRLRSQGIEVTRSDEQLPDLRANNVTFFYAEDRPSADRISVDVTDVKPTQRQFSIDDKLPRPGTIEVTIVQ